MPEDRPTMPPVMLHTEAELARDALSAPLFVRAVRLARWADPHKPVGAGGELLADELREAVKELGLDDDEDGPGYAAEAWQLALDIGLVEVEGPEGPEDAAEAVDADGAPADGTPLVPDADAPEPAGTARPGEELPRFAGGAPQEVLELWLNGLETVLADAAAPDLADIIDQLSEGDELDLDALDWNPEEEADFLDGVLGNLYLLTALDEETTDRAVPLPALAASMIVPDDMDEPTDAVLEEVSDAMMRLDEQFRMLAPTGIVDYRPVDEELIEEVDGEGRVSEPERGIAETEVDEEDVARYGMVRLTPLGLYAVRSRMLEAGVHAPVVGELAPADAQTLLAALPGFPDAAARAEAEQWLAGRNATDAAAELLAAARGDDPEAPLRRLTCQQTLTLVGPEAEPALRAVLEDPHLGGLARVWLAEHGVDQVPEPSEEMVFWLTVDTIAAQLAAGGDSEELRELVQGLVDRSAGFFDSVWRVEHPATAEVLEAMGRLHPDKKTAKEARKAAFKARSRH
ncbi:hypothetical protein H8N00_24370 [Streptomyces sp. AC563]|uniref:hypothetical protein n=1 Tax=Streptomyces buecherae TaxID=2763006 RepID=UPI00164E7C0A|nr:hypothetical protein [Streptomyces buecherae]MBC3991960.1 hypothetical protein [Streptomyces buecherae]